MSDFHQTLKRFAAKEWRRVSPNIYQKMSIHHCSEYGESKWIEENVVLPEKGYYVDVGCAWPFLYNNCAFLRDLGWSGLNVDGNPVYAEQWEGVAPFINCIISDSPFVRFATNGVPELSRIETIPMESTSSAEGMTTTRRLDELLADSPHVDFLSIDAEGHEFEALKTFDWQKNRPVCIVAEYATWTPEGVKEDYRVKEMLEAMGYRVVHKTVANLIYVR